jgi:hypothetical protein
MRNAISEPALVGQHGHRPAEHVGADLAGGDGLQPGPLAGGVDVADERVQHAGAMDALAVVSCVGALIRRSSADDPWWTVVSSTLDDEVPGELTWHTLRAAEDLSLTTG